MLYILTSIAYWELYLLVWLLGFVSSGYHNNTDQLASIYKVDTLYQELY